MSAEEAQALGDAEFWDERYAKADGDKPTHEWFRAFDALEPFFTKHLFASKKAEAQPRILHLGSGDSVSVPLLVLEEVARCSQSCIPAFTISPLLCVNTRLTSYQTIPYDLLSHGYTNQLCVDFSSVVVDLMKLRHSDKPQVEWKVGDVRAMINIDAKSVDVAFNKGTLDAMIYGSPWSPPEEVMENSGKYISEVCQIWIRRLYLFVFTGFPKITC